MITLSLSTLAMTPKEFAAGDVIRVTVSIKYVLPQQKTYTLFVVPYTRTLGVPNTIETCKGTAQITLPASLTETTVQRTVDFTLLPKAQGGIDNGTFGLKVGLVDIQAAAYADNVLIVSGNPSSSSWSDMIGIVMMMMVMGMMMPMMNGMFGDENGGSTKSPPTSTRPRNGGTATQYQRAEYERGLERGRQEREREERRREREERRREEEEYNRERREREEREYQYEQERKARRRAEGG